MLHLIKKLFGIAPSAPAVEAPYKVETTATTVNPLPAGTESVVVTPNAVVPKAVIPDVVEAKTTKAPAKPKTPPKPKVPAKPRAKKAPAK